MRDGMALVVGALGEAGVAGEGEHRRPGSLWPTRPSVEANMSITGTPKASVTAIRSGVLMASANEVTERRLSLRRPSRCSRASSASLAA